MLTFTSFTPFKELIQLFSTRFIRYRSLSIRSLRSLSLYVRYRSLIQVFHSQFTHSVCVCSLALLARLFKPCSRCVPKVDACFSVATLTSFAPFLVLTRSLRSLTVKQSGSNNNTRYRSLSLSIFTRFARSLYSRLHTVRTLHSLCSLHSLNRYAHELLHSA